MADETVRDDATAERICRNLILLPSGVDVATQGLVDIAAQRRAGALTTPGERRYVRGMLEDLQRRHAKFRGALVRAIAVMGDD